VKSSDEAVMHAIMTVFEKFDELGSARQVFQWWCRQGLQYPVRHLRSRIHPVAWLAPKSAMFLRTLHNPIFTGTCVFGRTKAIVTDPRQGPFNAEQAAHELGGAMGTVHRWLGTDYWPANNSPRARPGGSCSPMKSATGWQVRRRPRVGWE